MNLGQTRQLRERLRITEWNEIDSVMRECGHRRKGSGFLSSTVASGRNKDASELSMKAASRPETASGIPESLIVAGTFRCYS